MIRLASEAKQRKVVRAIKDANAGEGSDVRIGLHAINDTVATGRTLDDLSERFEKGEWGQSEIPITLDGTIAGYLPRRLQDAKTRLVVEMDGVPIEQMRGEKTMFLPGADAYSTDIISTSAGSLLTGRDSIKLGALTDYADPPHKVAWDAVSRLPYNMAHVEIEEVPGVVILWQGTTDSPGMLPHEQTGDVLTRLSGDLNVGYLYRDTASGGFIAWVPQPLGKPEYHDAPGHRRYASSQLPNWDLQRPMPPTERFSDVRVYHHDPASGELLWEVSVEVPYPPDVRQPHRKRTLDIPSDDTSGDGPHNAKQRATREAYEIARCTSTGDELLLPSFDPLLERYDALQVTEPRRDDDGLWEVVWAMRTTTYKHTFDAQANSDGGTLDTTIAYTATILSEDRIALPALLAPRPSGGVIGSPRPSYGIEGNDLYFDEPTSWVSTLGDDLIFDTVNQGRVTLDGEELAVNE